MMARTVADQIRSMAGNFIAGTNAKEALPVLQGLWKQGVGFSVDVLGEACVSDVEAQEYQRRYLDLVETLPDEVAKEMCLRFADLERKLGEIDRARAIYGHCAQLCDPRTAANFWSVWKEFEIKHGNEDTIREMLRIKRAVQATFNTQVNFMSAQMVAASAVEAASAAGGDMRALEDASQAQDDDDDFFLLLRQLADVVTAAAPAAATRLRLRRLEVFLERANLDEVDVARDGLALHGVAVGRLGVVGHRIAGVQAELFEVDGVTGRHFGQRLAAEQLDGFLFAAVDRVDELQLFDTEHCAPLERSMILGVSLITMGIIGIPILLVTGDPIVTYNGALVLQTAAAAATMYALAVEWTAVPAAGIIAGLLYGFHPVRLGNVTQPGELDTTWTLLAIFFARRLFARGRWFDAIGLGAACALLIAASFYQTLAASIFARGRM